MILFLITCIILMAFHELAHILMAKAVNMKIDKIGFTMKPLPHVYVSAINEKASHRKNALFLMSGNAMTWMLFVVLMISGRWFEVCYPVYIAFAVQLIFEMNPFFSDYTKLFCCYKYTEWLRVQLREGRAFSNKEIDSRRSFVIQEYMYSRVWYIHFCCWACEAIILLSPRLLPSIVQ